MREDHPLDTLRERHRKLDARRDLLEERSKRDRRIAALSLVSMVVCAAVFFLSPSPGGSLWVNAIRAITILVGGLGTLVSMGVLILFGLKVVGGGAASAAHMASRKSFEIKKRKVLKGMDVAGGLSSTAHADQGKLSPAPDDSESQTPPHQG